MNKWSYLKARIAWGETFFLVECDQIDSNLLSAIFSGRKIEKVKRGINVTVNNLTESIAFEIQVLDYLGSQGWEAYAHDESTYYFKRQT